MKTLTARFTETTTSTLLTKPITSRGRLWVERPSRVILRYTDPDVRVVLMDGNRMTVAWPSRNINQTIDITAAQGRVQKYFVNGTAADLRRQFEIETRDDGDGRPGAYYVSMVPKRKQIRETLARLELWVDRTSMLLDEMKMTFANGDLKTMTFEDVVTNAPARRPHVQPRSVAVLEEERVCGGRERVLAQVVVDVHETLRAAQGADQKQGVRQIHLAQPLREGPCVL